MALKTVRLYSFRKRQAPSDAVDDFITKIRNTVRNWAFGQIELVRVNGPSSHKLSLEACWTAT